MLGARSIAVVGASARPGSFGRQLVDALSNGGFRGAVYPVNPRHEEIDGLDCLDSLTDVPEPVDLAILGIPNAGLEQQLELAAACGARSAVIFASCYSEPQPGKASLADRLTEISRRAGISLCGGNCMGFLNLHEGLRVCGYPMPEELAPGGITFISHSGSAFAAMAHNDRRLRFNLMVSSGQEFVTSASNYLDYAVGLDSTRAVGMFIETVRDPDAFRAALAAAARRDVPVFVLKVGQNEQARAMVAAHSGALAGNDGAFEALFDAYGVMRVATLDEMADALELFVTNRRAGRGALASVHDSGGERAHFIDTAATAGVTFAHISDSTEAALRDVLEEGLPAVNPLDAWGTGNDYEDVYSRCIDALMDDPTTAALALCVDLTAEADPEGGYIKVAHDVFRRHRKPFAVLSNLASAIDRAQAASLRAAGIPVLEGTLTGLAAFRHLFAYRDRLPSLEVPAPESGARSEKWRLRLAGDEALPELEGLELLRDYGIEVIPTVPAATAEQAVDAARRIGYPVALKSAAPGLAHKSDAGGVRLDIRNENELRGAYDHVARRLGAEVIVAALAPAGIELALGVVRDPQFGPLVLIAAGGVLIELVGDRKLALPPLDQERAQRLLDGLETRRLLDGLRGAQPADLDAVARALVHLSRLTMELGDLLDAVDVNPLVATPSGCVAVDALVVPRARRVDR